MSSSKSKSFTESIRQQKADEREQTARMIGAISDFFGNEGITRVEIGDLVIDTQAPEAVEANTNLEKAAKFLDCNLIRIQTTEGIPLFGSRTSWDTTSVEEKIDLATILKMAPSVVVYEHVGNELESYDSIVLAVPESQADEFHNLKALGSKIVLPGFSKRASVAYSFGVLKTSHFTKITEALKEIDRADDAVEAAAEKAYVLSQLRQAGRHLIIAHDTGLAQEFGLPVDILDKVDDWDRLFTKAKAAETAAKRRRKLAYDAEREARRSLWVEA